MERLPGRPDVEIKGLADLPGLLLYQGDIQERLEKG
jgi:hypothetical protein